MHTQPAETFAAYCVVKSVKSIQIFHYWRQFVIKNHPEAEKDAIKRGPFSHTHSVLFSRQPAVVFIPPFSHKDCSAAVSRTKTRASGIAHTMMLSVIFKCMLYCRTDENTVQYMWKCANAASRVIDLHWHVVFPDIKRSTWLFPAPFWIWLLPESSLYTVQCTLYKLQ